MSLNRRGLLKGLLGALAIPFIPTPVKALDITKWSPDKSLEEYPQIDTVITKPGKYGWYIYVGDSRQVKNIQIVTHSKDMNEKDKASVGIKFDVA